MAPPVPVYSLNDIKSKYKQQLTEPEKYQCHLKSITQHECTFKPDPNRINQPEIICLPFKRIFQRCLIDTKQKIDGKKVILKKWINIEITNNQTNKDLLITHGNIVKEFMNAEQEFKKLMEIESDGSL